MTNPILRPIRSFIRREGRLTSGQAYALDTHWQQFGLEKDSGQIEYNEVFGNAGRRVLEIGFGMGNSLVTMAERMPDHQFIGIEVHRPGVGSLINQAERLGLTNLKTYADDAVQVLKQCIPNDHLDVVQIFFPDPWHKRKHHKRRLIQTEFLDLIQTKLKIGGTLHVATDWQDYATHILRTLSAHPHYANTSSSGDYCPRPAHRPQTKFEARGTRLGHGVWDIIFQRAGTI